MVVLRVVVCSDEIFSDVGKDSAMGLLRKAGEEVLTCQNSPCNQSHAYCAVCTLEH